MTSPIDIRADHLRIVQDVLQRHLPAGVTVWVFGSRASWMTKDSSDLDLALDGDTEIPPRSLSALEAAFEDSDLPYAVDIVDLKRINERFRRIVEQQRVPLSENGSSRSTDWPVMSLREAGISLIDCEHRTPPASEDGYPYVGIPQIKDGRVDLGGARRIAQEHFREWTRKANPRPFDVVLSRRCNPGDTGFVSARSFEFALGQNLVLLRADGEKILKPFLRWLVRSPEWWNQIDKYLNVGAVFDSLKCVDIPEFLLHIPPLPDQRAITHVLGTLDDKIELGRRMNATLEAMARALFQSWFVDFDPVRAKMEGRDTGLPKDIADLFPDRLVDSELGEIPEGWMPGTLGDIVSLNPESWATGDPPQSVEYVDLTNTKWGYIERVEAYPWEQAPSRARRVLRKGDTIVATVRPGNGSFALIDEDGLTGSTGFAALRPRRLHDRELVWCAATSSDGIDRLAHLADGGAYPAVRPDAVVATPVVLADCGARKAFASSTAALFDRIETNKRASRVLTSLRDVLLPRLVAGELRIPVANRTCGERSNG